MLALGGDEDNKAAQQQQQQRKMLQIQLPIRKRTLDQFRALLQSFDGNSTRHQET